LKATPKSDEKRDMSLYKELGHVIEQYDAKFKRQNEIIYYAKPPEKTPDLVATKNLVNPEKLELTIEADAAWTESVYKAFDVSKLVFEDKKENKKNEKDEEIKEEKKDDKKGDESNDKKDSNEKDEKDSKKKKSKTCCTVM